MKRERRGGRSQSEEGRGGEKMAEKERGGEGMRWGEGEGTTEGIKREAKEMGGLAVHFC